MMVCGYNDGCRWSCDGGDDGYVVYDQCSYDGMMVCGYNNGCR